MTMNQEQRKKHLAKLAKGNIGKALFQEFDVEIANLKEQLLEAETIEEVQSTKKAVQVILNLKSKINSANRSNEVNTLQSDYE